MPYDSRQCLPTAELVERLHHAVEDAAKASNLSPAHRQIYGTWIFGFVCWCLRNPPNCVTEDRIEAFRRTLIERSDVDREDEHQALDALGFFFGTVDMSRLDVRTSRPRPATKNGTASEHGRPFVFYNQVDPSDGSAQSPVHDALASSERSLLASLDSPPASLSSLPDHIYLLSSHSDTE